MKRFCFSNRIKFLEASVEHFSGPNMFYRDTILDTFGTFSLPKQTGSTRNAWSLSYGITVSEHSRAMLKFLSC